MNVCELYGLSDDPNPSIDVYPVFQCGYANTKEEKYKEALCKLFDELETRVATTPLTLPEKLVEGKNGRRNLDYGIESRTTGRTIGLIEVKKDDFKQGFAQATVQMESSLSRKRKVNEIDDEKPVFKLSKPLFVAYEDEGMKDMVEKVLAHILWLLEEAQKPVKALEESREIKRVRSGELPKVTDLEGKTN
ncbi:hypothetical protein RhiirC2_858701 [Rhizophagus irregularis]|uniref:Uncharacterized protein n=1 Tax=Rhizophagus irregularis TaxID=588596 RepID=A0A2N1M3R4_9GLOM|nr:hypothetical protein RhiirC2_858701 [Rhizophagus irregularis]